MGYSTNFYGNFSVTPSLNQQEVKFLEKFGSTRRMNRKQGPYYIQADEAEVINYNDPPNGQPSLWCQWVPTKDGTGLKWDDGEKFYKAGEWIVYIIEHFLKENAYGKIACPQIFAPFENHEVNGTVYAQGEESEDIWKIEIIQNKVFVLRGEYTYPFDEEELGEDAYYDAIDNHKINWGQVKWSDKEEIKYQETPEDLQNLAQFFKDTNANTQKAPLFKL